MRAARKRRVELWRGQIEMEASEETETRREEYENRLETLLKISGLRQYFADYGEQVMPAFQYTNQTSLSAMASKLGFRVVKPQNKFRLHYYSHSE
jgi:hypothetical protein